MSKGPPASAELIEAIRRCAAAKMSYAVTADELTTRQHPLSRSAIAGIAKRNGITFSAKVRPPVNGTKKKPGLRRSKRHYEPAKPKTAAPDKPRPNFVTVSVRAYVRPPRTDCSWAGCTSCADEGSMFCFSHGRKALMA